MLSEHTTHNTLSGTHESMHSCSSWKYGIRGWSWLRLSSFCRSCTTFTCCATMQKKHQSEPSATPHRCAVDATLVTTA